MRALNVILMLLLVGVSGSAAADWVLAGRDEGATVYVDTAAIHKNGVMVKMSELIDYNTARVDEFTADQYLSKKMEYEFDCKDGQSRVAYSSFHSGNMAGGKVVKRAAGGGMSHPVAHGTQLETLWKLACGKE